MLFLLALPVLAFAEASHRWLRAYAPTNLVITRARLAPPKLRTVVLLGTATVLLILAMRAIELLIAAGAPGWLNLVVLALAWDAIKFGLASGGVAFGWVRGVAATALWAGDLLRTVARVLDAVDNRRVVIVYLDSATENLVPELGLRVVSILPERWNGWLRPLGTADAFGNFLDAWRRNDPNGSWGWATEVGDTLVCSRSDDDDPADEFPKVDTLPDGRAVYDFTGWAWVESAEV